MYRAFRRQKLFLISLLLIVGCAPVDAATSGERQVTGTFRWNQGSGKDKPLEARLSPVSTGVWNATFTFRFNGSRHRWSGELQGSLEEGQVTGSVSQGRGRRPRTWRLEGTVRDGVLEARHYEQRRRGGETLTGTIRLRLNS